jgi:hypothetical protein
MKECRKEHANVFWNVQT